jgi:CTP synthase (UTP-ammonia lyase)
MEHSMTSKIRIGLIGDFNPDVKAHIAIPRAVALAANALACDAETSWLATSLLEHDTEELLPAYDALWCVPASPYASMEGALSAIRFAREQGVPFLGTCGGSQHAIIEYARSVFGLAEADHTETNPSAELPLIAPLVCSLVEVQDTIYLKPGSRIAAIYGRTEIVEAYHCSYGLNPHYHSLFEQGGMHITGVDVNEEARVIELVGHPFFVGTLFQPERSAFAGTAHPLIMAYLQATTETMRAKSKS